MAKGDGRARLFCQRMTVGYVTPSLAVNFACVRSRHPRSVRTSRDMLLSLGKGRSPLVRDGKDCRTQCVERYRVQADPSMSNRIRRRVDAPLIFSEAKWRSRVFGGQVFIFLQFTTITSSDGRMILFGQM